MTNHLLFATLVSTIVQLTTTISAAKYDTILACEGSAVNITCRQGTHISLIRANFGRFSISICNDQGNPGMKVDCMSPISFRVLSEFCEHKRECQVEATTDIFGNPCPGTSKYLEVHYQCKSDHHKRPGSRPNSSWNNGGRPSPNNKQNSHGQWTTTLTTTTSTTTTFKPSVIFPSNDLDIDIPPSETNSDNKWPFNGNVIPVREKEVTSDKPYHPFHSHQHSHHHHHHNNNNNNQHYNSEVTIPTTFRPISSSSSSYQSSSDSSLSSLTTISPVLPVSNWPDHPPYRSTSSPSSSSSSSSSRLPSSKSTNMEAEPTHSSHALPSNTSELSDHYLCPPALSRDLFWNWTHPDEMVTQRCPPGSEGLAVWHCSSAFSESPIWLKSEADLSGCRSKWLLSMENRLREPREPVINFAIDLAKSTRVRSLYGGDMFPIIDIISQLIRRMEAGLAEYPEDKKNQFVQEVLKYVQETCSNLLGDIQKEAWYDLPPPERIRAAAALVNEFERTTVVFMETLSQSGDYKRISDNLYLSIHTHPLDHLPHGLRLPLEDSNDQLDLNLVDNDFESYEKSNPIYLPRISLADLTRRNMIRIGYVVYSKLGHLLDPISKPYGGPGLGSEDLGNGDGHGSSVIATIVNSDIVGVLIPKDGSTMILLREPIEILFRHLIVDNITNARCVFWDSRQWSEFGCQTVSSNDTHTACRCNHLTNFAVLVDLTRNEITGFHGLLLHNLTQIGCIVSSLCLCICLLTFLVYKNLRSERTCIHANLCLCLLAVQLIFVLGIDQVQLGLVCTIIGALLHYFLLASFFWMLIEGYHLYSMLIEVFEAERSRLPIYFVTSYLSPVIIVGLTLALSVNPYGHDNLCWLRSTVVLSAFILPVIIVILCNFVFLIIAQCAMCRHISTSFVHKEMKHQERIKQIRFWARGSLALVFLLGLTWSLGLLYIILPSLLTAYLFTFFNVFQGVFIFIFQCLSADKVRREYYRTLGRLSWLTCPCCHGKGCVCSASRELDKNYAGHDARGSSSVPVVPLCSSAGHSSGLHGVTGDSGYPESEEPMIGPCGLGGQRQIIGANGSQFLLNSEVATDEKDETRALMESLSHSDATTGPMRPIIMRGDPGLTRIEHLYEAIPEDTTHYNMANMFISSALSGHQQQNNPRSYQHQQHLYHQPHSADYQQLHLFSNKTLHSQGNHKQQLINRLSRDKYVGGGQGSLDRTGLGVRRGSEELLPAIIRDNTRSPYVSSLSSSPASSTASAASSSSSSSTNNQAAAATTTTTTTRLNIPVSPRPTRRSTTGQQRIPTNQRKARNVVAKLQGNQIVSSTALNGELC